MHTDVLSVLNFTQQAIRTLRPDARVVCDATVGNGHDTLFLAELCGPHGTLLGFDIQSQALSTTRSKLASIQSPPRLLLFERSHELLSQTLDENAIKDVDVVMFNLGYLPGAEKSLSTKAASTVSALSQALQVLAKGGVLSVCCYVGHPGGCEERDAVLAWIQGLDARLFRSVRYQHLLSEHAPECFLVVRKSD